MKKIIPWMGFILFMPAPFTVYSQPGTGFIVINKATVPLGGTGFGFTDNIPGGPASFDLDHGGSRTFSNIPTGTYTVTENDPSGIGYSLGLLVCTDTDLSGTPSTIDVQTRTATINLDANETVTCTFTNRQLSSITITKATVPVGGTGFGFTDDIPGGPATFSLDHSGSRTFTNVADGTYTVSEDDPSGLGYSLAALVCVDTDLTGTPSTFDIPSRTATINLDPGETVTCAFTNRQLSTIIISKVTAPVGGTGFSFADNIPGGPATFDLDHGESQTFTNVAEGTYTVTEDDPSGLNYSLSALICLDSDLTGTPSTSDIPSRTATIHLDPGETVACAFTNAQPGMIIISKTTVPFGGTGFQFTHNILGGSAGFTLDHAGFQSFGNVAEGTYTVTEVDPTGLGYRLLNLVCVDSDLTGTPSTVDISTRTATIHFDEDETVACIFHNGINPVEKEKQEITTVPVLSPWGMLTLIVLCGVGAVMLVSRRKAHRR